MTAKEEQKKLLESLDTIRNECIKHDKCIDCPICHSIEGCTLKARSPQKWVLSNEKEIWHAFNQNY